MIRWFNDKIVGRESLRTLRKDVKTYTIEHELEDDGAEINKDKLREQLTTYKDIAYTHYENYGATLLLIGALSSFFFGIKVLAAFATTFVAETIYRKHLLDFLAYNHIHESDSRKEAAFKLMWNERALTPITALVRIANVAILAPEDGIVTQKYAEDVEKISKMLINE